MKRQDDNKVTVSLFRLRNLARCRAAYGLPDTDEKMLFENVMVEIQDILYEVGINYDDFNPDENLEN